MSYSLSLFQVFNFHQQPKLFAYTHTVAQGLQGRDTYDPYASRLCVLINHLGGGNKVSSTGRNYSIELPYPYGVLSKDCYICISFICTPYEGVPLALEPMPAKVCIISGHHIAIARTHCMLTSLQHQPHILHTLHKYHASIC